MIVLGLDPSLTAYGWAIVAIDEAPAHVVLDRPGPRVLFVGCIRTAPESKQRHVYQADRDSQRIIELGDGLLRAMALHPKIDRIVCEAPAGSQHALAAKALGQSLGVTLGILVSHGRTVRFVQAHEVKKAIGGSKGASKDEVAAGVKARTGWTSSASSAPAREGEADAVAVALTLEREMLSERS